MDGIYDLGHGTGGGPNYNNVVSPANQQSPYKPPGGYPIVLPDGNVVLAELAYPATGSTGKSTAGGPAPDQVARVFANELTNPTNTDSKLYTVTAGKSFYLTDCVVTASASAVMKLKARVATTQGATTAGSNTVFSFPAASLNAVNGDPIYVGQTLYLEDPSSGSYEAVKVTAVARTGGFITGVTVATTTFSHAANVTIAYPIVLAAINTTKGIEIIGQETQPSVAGGWDLVVTYGAVTGSVYQNIAGFEQ